MISPNSLDLRGRDWLRTHTKGITPGRGSSIRSELSPDDDDDNNNNNNNMAKKPNWHLTPVFLDDGQHCPLDNG